ncbi:MAG: hypothetical protein EB168_09145 [Euryarchaeota archaeon]|nr:hypothetical protein [Euryarchaeota archaeon]
MKPWLDLKWLALAIVGTVLILLTLGAVVRAFNSGEGLEPGIASAAFALLGAMVAGSLGATAITKKDKDERSQEED